ncbi:MAG TPA: sigma-54 dependent transcriptional regulator [Longimicrobium sp.]
MIPRLFILALSDSFSTLWPTLAETLDADAVVERAPAAEALAQAAALVVSAAGCERQAALALAELPAGSPAAAVVGACTEYRAVLEVIRAGAADYFALPDDLPALRAWLQQRVEAARAEASARAQAEEERRHYDFSRMLGNSPALREVLDRAARVIPAGSATVLITGETGTGKDLLAQTIHYNGPRAGKPFVELNCAAVPASLLEAELFGYERGAFTDARHPKPGLFEVANGGTLFLDEIGDLPLELQVKLLRVLETKTTRRLGSVASMPLDVRILAATHVDLNARVRDGAFRRDLFYRLNVVPLRLPPLRERGDDVELLAEHFARRFSEEYGMPFRGLSAEVRAHLRRHPWPGNIRELRNAVERAVILGQGTVHAEHLALGDEGVDAARGVLPFPATLAQIEVAAARAAVEACGGNKTRAAGMLGISRKGLYALLGPNRGVRG